LQYRDQSCPSSNARRPARNWWQSYHAPHVMSSVQRRIPHPASRVPYPIRTFLSRSLHRFL